MMDLLPPANLTLPHHGTAPPSVPAQIYNLSLECNSIWLRLFIRLGPRDRPPLINQTLLLSGALWQSKLHLRLFIILNLISSVNHGWSGRACKSARAGERAQTHAHARGDKAVLNYSSSKFSTEQNGHVFIDSLGLFLAVFEITSYGVSVSEPWATGCLENSSHLQRAPARAPFCAWTVECLLLRHWVPFFSFIGQTLWDTITPPTLSRSWRDAPALTISYVAGSQTAAQRYFV